MIETEKIFLIATSFIDMFILLVAIFLQIFETSQHSGLPLIFFLINTISTEIIILLQFVYYFIGQKLRFYQPVLLYIILNSIIYGIMIYLRYFEHYNIELESFRKSIVNMTLILKSTAVLIFALPQKFEKNHSANNSPEKSGLNNSYLTTLLLGMSFFTSFVILIGYIFL